MMLEDAAKQFALPTMTCPVTGEFSPRRLLKDVAQLLAAALLGESLIADRRVLLSRTLCKGVWRKLRNLR